MTAPPHPDHSLVAAARSQDADAVEWLANQLRSIPRLIRHLAVPAMGLGDEDVADVAQEVACVVLARLAGYQGLAPFQAWVYRVCEWTLNDVVRRRRRSAAAALEVEPVAADEEPAANVDAGERRARVRAAIDAVGGVEAEVIRARHLEGASFASIAARTGIAMATLRTRYYRGLAKLRLRLAPSPTDLAHE